MKYNHTNWNTDSDHYWTREEFKDTLEVVEATPSKNVRGYQGLLNGKSVGPVADMPDGAMYEAEKAWKEKYPKPSLKLVKIAFQGNYSGFLETPSGFRFSAWGTNPTPDLEDKFQNAPVKLVVAEVFPGWFDVMVIWKTATQD